MAKKKESTDSRKTKWIAEYRALQPSYERYCNKLQTLLEELLAAEGITYHVIESRAKTLDSFGDKLNREGKGYSDPIKEITDLAGVRIILYYTNDVIKVSDLIEREFSVDRQRSVDKKATLAPDQFGYLSVHKIIRTSQSRSGLAEWALSIDFAAEVQIRTVLQHSWAAISHALQYKHEGDVPNEFRRRLNRLAGLLELADEEFASLREQQSILRKDIAEKVSEGKLDITIDSLSIAEFVRTSKLVKGVAREAELSGMEMEEVSIDDEAGVSQLVKASQMSSVSTIRELQNILRHSKSNWGTFFREFMKVYPKTGYVQGSYAHSTAMLLLALRTPPFRAEQLISELGWGLDYAQTVIKAGKIFSSVSEM